MVMEGEYRYPSHKAQIPVFCGRPSICTLRGWLSELTVLRRPEVRRNSEPTFGLNAESAECDAKVAEGEATKRGSDEATKGERGKGSAAVGRFAPETKRRRNGWTE